MKIRKLIEISSLKGGTHATGQWRRRAEGTILCSNCHNVLHSYWPKPCNVELYEDPNYQISGSIWWIGLSIFHKDFLVQIKRHLEQFVMGECFDEHGKKYEYYLTCYTNSYIVIRGNKESKYNICEKCGLVEQNGWHGKQYTLSQYLSDAMVYMDVGGSMYIDEMLAHTIDFSAWPDVELKPIAVYDKPRDGRCLPIDSPDTQITDGNLSRFVINTPTPQSLPILGEAILDEKFLQIREMSLGLYIQQDEQGRKYAKLFLKIGEGTEEGWKLLILDMPMINVQGIEDLIDARIHFNSENGVCPDDTVGAVPDELIEQSRWNFGNKDGEYVESNYWSFEGLLINFKQIQDDYFRVYLEAELTNWEDPTRKTTGSVEFRIVIKVCPPTKES